MKFNEMIYVGIEITSGSRPLICASLDPDQKVKFLERYSVSKLISQLHTSENIMLAINVSFQNSAAHDANGHKVFKTLEKEIVQAGFKPYLSSQACRQWVETYPLECFSALAKQPPFPNRSIRGRVQRSEILCEQGIQINGRKKSLDEARYLTMGTTTATLYTPSELNALVAACIAWMLVNMPVKIDLTRGPGQRMISIPREDKNWWKKKQIVRFEK